jgi:hypothetical protein
MTPFSRSPEIEIVDSRFAGWARPGPVSAREPSKSIRKRLVLAVILGVMLARLASVVRGVSGMAVRRMGVVRGGLVRIRFVMLGCLAMMLGGVLVMFSCGVMMLDDLVLGHDALRPG